MNSASLLVFAAAYLAVVILPGPGVTALVARVLARGTHGAPAFVAGFAAGSLIWFTVAATGLAALATAFAGVFVAIRYLGAAYLAYLAWKLWRAPVRPMQDEDASPDGWGRLFLTGMAINLGNPKAIVFFLALLPTVIDLSALTLPGYVALAGTMVVILTCVFTVYVTAAARARRFFTSPRAGRVVNRCSGAAMAGAAAAVVAR